MFIQWSTFDIVIVSLGAAAVVAYLIIKICTKNKPKKVKAKKQKGKVESDKDIIDMEEWKKTNHVKLAKAKAP